MPFDCVYSCCVFLLDLLDFVFTTRFRRDVWYEHMPMIRGDSLWISTNRIRNNDDDMSARHCYNSNRRRPWWSFIQAARGV
jgi:phage-related tail fiber protein